MGGGSYRTDDRPEGVAFFVNFGLTIDLGWSGVMRYKYLLDRRVNGSKFNSVGNDGGNFINGIFGEKPIR